MVTRNDDQRRRSGLVIGSPISRRTFVKGAAVLIGASALSSGTARAAAAKPRSSAVAVYSSLAWDSGCWNGNDAPSEATAFGDWRGNPVDVAVAWPDLTSWSTYTEQPNSIYNAFSGTPFPIVWGISPIPFDGSATMADVAAGAYNTNWANFANTMIAYGLDNSVIRLAWEFNGDWYPWGGDPDFVAAWQQIVDTVRPIAPGLQWDWNPNAGSDNGFPGDAVLGAYPGDSYVDMVGVDAYDKGTTIDNLFNGEYGLQYWLNFAIAHSKRLSVPEWGLWTSSNGGNDDDPDYITMMYNFLANNASNIGFDAYFNDADPSIGNSLYNPDLCPNSAAVYQNLFCGGGGGNNLVTNPGFESGVFDPWVVSSPNGTEGAVGLDNGGGVPHSGSYSAYQWSSSSAFTVDLHQSLTVPNGTYTLSAWVNNLGPTQNTCYMYVKNYGGSEMDFDVLSLGQTDGWTQVSIPGVNVTSGSAEIGFYSDAPVNAAVRIDDVTLEGSSGGGGQDEVTNPGFESGVFDPWVVSSPNGTEGAVGLDNGGGVPHSGSYSAYQWSSSSAFTVDLHQSLTVPNGTYTLSAWVNNLGPTQNTCYMYVKNYGGSEMDFDILSLGQTDGWTQISIPGVNVTSGSAEIGFYSDAPVNAAVRIDDVTFQ